MLNYTENENRQLSTEDFFHAVERMKSQGVLSNPMWLVARTEEQADYYVYHYPKCEVFYKNCRYGVQPIS